MIVSSCSTQFPPIHVSCCACSTTATFCHGHRQPQPPGTHRRPPRLLSYCSKSSTAPPTHRRSVSHQRSACGFDLRGSREAAAVGGLGLSVCAGSMAEHGSIPQLSRGSVQKRFVATTSIHILMRSLPGSYIGRSDARALYLTPAISTSHLPLSMYALLIGSPFALSHITSPTAEPSCEPRAHAPMPPHLMIPN